MQLSFWHERWVNCFIRQRVFWSAIALLLVIWIPLPIQALTVQEVPNPRKAGVWVTDMAALLSPPTQAQVNKMLAALEAKNGTEMAVVTVPNTAPSASPKAFATELFNTWHIGKVGRDNGLLVLISKEDRRVEVETGYGVEAVLSDARVGNIIHTQMTPAFKQGKFDAGVLAGTTALVQILDTVPSDRTPQSSGHFSSLVGLVGMGLVAVGYGGMLIVAWRPARVHPEGTKQFEGVSGKRRHTKQKDFEILPVIRSMVPDFGKRGKNWFWLAALGFALVGGGLFASWATPSTPIFLISLMIVPCSLISLPFLLAIHLLLAPQTRSQVVKSYCRATLLSMLGILVAELLIWAISSVWSPTSLSFCVGAIALGLAFLLFHHLEQEDKKQLRLQRPVGCLNCKSELQELPWDELNQHLTPAQLQAEDLGNMQYRAWYCSSCRPLLTGEKIYLLSCLQDDQLVCSQCHEATLTRRTQVLAVATMTETGKQQNSSVCHYCGARQEEEVILPRIVVKNAANTTRYSSSSSSQSSDDSSHSSSSDSWSSSDSSSRSGSDFSSGMQLKRLCYLHKNTVSCKNCIKCS